MEDMNKNNAAGAENTEEMEQEESTAYEIPIEDGASEPETETEEVTDGEAEGESTNGESTEETEEAPASLSKAAMEKVAALEDRVKRQMAEFDNFRKRTDREKEQMFSMGERSVIEKMLPVVDNSERGLAAVPEGEKDSALASGMEMIYKQLMKQLEDLGVAPIEAVGKPFDPNFHNAVMQVESDEYESGTVAQEFQKGYLYHDTVIRHSMVGVVQ